MASDEHVCPVCGHLVEQVVRRHKALGVFVPLWRPGPCKNPECQVYEAEEAGVGARPHDGERTGGRQGQAAGLLTLFP